MRASSQVTIEATLAPHKKARRRRLSRGHSSFSLLLLLHHSPSADKSRKELLTANLDADQNAFSAILFRIKKLRFKLMAVHY
jgi:hypothetical protein